MMMTMASFFRPPVAVGISVGSLARTTLQLQIKVVKLFLFSIQHFAQQLSCKLVITGGGRRSRSITNFGEISFAMS